MSKILFTEHRENGDVNYIGGKVTYVSPGSGSAEGKVINVGMALDVYNKEQQEVERNYLNIAFWNGDKRNLADAVTKAKVKPGDFLIVVTGGIRDAGETKNGTLKKSTNGFGFNFSKKLDINNSHEAIVHGNVRNIYSKDNAAYVTVAVFGPKKSEVLYSITFPEKDGAGNMRHLNTRAEKLLKKGSSVCILTGPIKDNEKDGKTYHNAFAYDFVVGHDSKASSNTYEGSEAEGEEEYEEDEASPVPASF